MHQTFEGQIVHWGEKEKKKKEEHFACLHGRKLNCVGTFRKKSAVFELLAHCTVFFFIPDILGLKPPYFACLILGSTSVRSRNFAVGGDNV